MVSGHGVVGFGVVRLELDPLAEVLHQLEEVALAVVVTGHRQVDRRFARLGVAALQVGFFRQLVFARVFIDLGELEVVGWFVGSQFDHALHHRFGLGRVGQLVWAIGRNQELKGQRSLRNGVFRQFLAREFIVLDSLVYQLVVSRLTLAGRPVHVVVRVGQVEVDGGVIRIEPRRLLVLLGRRPPIAAAVRLVAVLERLHGADLADISATGKRDAQSHNQRQTRCRRPLSHQNAPCKSL